MRRRIPNLSLYLAGTLLVAAFGCRDATAPATTAAAAPNAGAPAFDYGSGGGQGNHYAWGNPHLLTCAAHDSASVTVTVGTSGATIQVGNDRLIIPGGALSQSTTITATIPADTLADIHFEPHGLQFNKDVHLVLSTNGCSTGSDDPDDIVYLDNAGNVLETLEGTFSGSGHTVTAKIHHFSSYAIAF